MGILDSYYRGFKDYRSNTLDDKLCQKDRKIYKKSGLEFDKLEITKYLCTIESDWIEAIEKGLEYVEKAVKEERQFITTNGEIVPIEKAKKVSKDTVAHLARHANMITRVPKEGDDLIPDKLFMVEKLSDFAVYENRFLYMLLCYLRDFISLRLEKIQKLRMTYTCYLKLKKNYDSKKRKLDFETEFSEKRYDNPYPIPDEECDKLIKRIEDIQQIVNMLLNTNLMQEVSKVAMLKPPITKTNVLKMNNNFKNSLALYDYIATYKGDGFTSEEIKKDFVPLSDACADELAEIAALTSFLTYKIGNEIEDALEIAFQEEENRRKKEEADRLLEQIKRLKKRVVESGMGMEEYMLALEKRNRLLEADSIALIQARNEIIELNNKIEELNQEIIELNRKIESLYKEIDDLVKEIARLNQKYIDDMNALKKKHAEEIMELREAHQNEIDELNDEHELEIRRIEKRHEENVEYIKSRHQDEINAINDEHSEEVASLHERLAVIRGEVTSQYEDQIQQLNDTILQKNNELNNEIANYNEKINGLNNDINDLNHQRLLLIDEYENKLNNLKNTFKYEYDSMVDKKTTAHNELQGINNDLVEKNRFLSAELNAIRYRNGLLKPCDDYTSKERFEELEREFLAFNDFFKKQWQKTKKQIRKLILWNKDEEKRVIEQERRLKLEKKAEKQRAKESKPIVNDNTTENINSNELELNNDNTELENTVIEQDAFKALEETIQDINSNEPVDNEAETEIPKEAEAFDSSIEADNSLDSINEVNHHDKEALEVAANEEILDTSYDEENDDNQDSNIPQELEEEIGINDEAINNDSASAVEEANIEEELLEDSMDEIIEYDYEALDEYEEVIEEEVIYVDEDGNPIDISELEDYIEK